jgi:ATP-binding cassette subfamily B protein
MNKSIFQNISKVWRFISPNRKFQFKVLLILMIFTTFFEILSIGSILPFLSVITNPHTFFEIKTLKPVLIFFNINKSEDLILVLTIIFCIASIISAGMRILYLNFSVRFSFLLGSDLSNEIYHKTLHQPYIVHISRNSSEIINGIWNKVSEVIFYVILPITTLINSSILVIILVPSLILIIPKIALIAILGLIIIYIFFINFTKYKLAANSEKIAKESDNVLKTLQEGLSGIRDVLIDNSQFIFSKKYKDTNEILRRAQGNVQIISQIPRSALEALGMILLALVAYFMSKSQFGISVAIPSIAALALGLQRLLPNTQQLYSSWSTIKGAQSSLIDVVNLLEQPYPDNFLINDIEIIKFNDTIKLTNISFKYKEASQFIFNDFNLLIKKGSRVGFIGTTGCGKSTLLDILMGLLKPNKGSIFIDDVEITEYNLKNWQRHIAHVPQNVFLSDNSIRMNIAFGIPEEKIDHEKVKLAAKQAQLNDIIESWPMQYETRVGERGVQLSGGQCQRIGIARALYKNADVIIFDEATSALDQTTEKSVMDSIEMLSENITLLIVAHRINTLEKCTEIYEIKNGLLFNYFNK